MIIKTIYTKDIDLNKTIMADRSAGSFPEQERIVDDIFENIKNKGDKALFDYTKRFDKADINAGNIAITDDEIKEAYELIDKDLLDTIKRAAKNIRDFHEKQVRNTWTYSPNPGITLGQKVTPMENVGVYVPGGKASYPSTVLMDVIPASVAKAENIYVVSPPNPDGKLSPQIICAGMEAGATKIFKIGGAQAVFALALGTESVPRVDKIVGPGNIFVALAKKRVFGRVGLDSIAGPSEICVLCDDKANPSYVAADLMSQAEHDEMAASVLVTTSKVLADNVLKEIDVQIAKMPRAEIIEKSLLNNGLIVIADNIDDAIAAVNNVAPEHLEVMTENPRDILPKIKHAGAIFLGAYTSEPLGDYFAGPDHVLPTNGTARFFSPLSVDDFIKTSSIIEYDKDCLDKAGDDVIRFAEAEGLFAHANSIKVRRV